MTGEIIAVAVIEGFLIFILLFERYRLARRLREAQCLSVEDPLTGIGNRRKLDIALHSAHASACRAFFPRDGSKKHSFPIALMVIDMDQFKSVNDVHGHAVGDTFIKELAKEIRRKVRQTDTIARIGGDEFCILVLNVHEPVCIEIAKRISEDFRGYGYRSDMENPPTISAGLCVFESKEIVESPEKIQEMLNKADQRLLLAKASGKNQLVGDNGVSVPL